MFLQNPEPILKQTKSEMNTNPLIIGKVENHQIKIMKRKKLFMNANKEFTETINDICYEIYKEQKINLTRKKIKWLTIILTLVILLYIFIN